MTALIKELQRALGVTDDGIYGPATHRAALIRLGIPVDAPEKPAERASRNRALRDPEAFYRAVRGVSGALEQVQVDTITGLLAKAAHWPISWLAYGLATAWHEARLKPIEEIGKGRGRRYGVAGARSDGKTSNHGGQVPYGRGLVQLTWADNYEKADRELGLNGALVSDYSLALRPDIAAAILVQGMEEGWFTAKKLGDYLPDERGTEPQFVQARRIINGTDRAQLIATYAAKFQDALAAGGWA